MVSIKFRLLGEVEAVRDGRPLVLGSARPRAVLAALLLDANNPVSLDELSARVWGEKAPTQARNSLHSYFTRLRSALTGHADIVRRGPGYVLHADPDTIDVHRFRQSAELARNTNQPTEALRHFNAALQLWTGEPFTGLDSPWLDHVRTTLHADRESILHDQADLRLALGQHTQLVPELSARAEQHPLDERLAAQLMLALYRDGRHAEALLRYQKIKEALADELGVDPAGTLRTLHQAMLQADPALTLNRSSSQNRTDVTTTETRKTPAYDQRHPLVPRQLAAAPRSFIGRKAELDALSASLVTPDAGPTPPLIIVGPGGVGKTWLALRWAHEHADLFPDGQLFINLRGFEPSVERLSPYIAMRNCLISCQVSPQAIPDDPDAVTGLYRSMLADKRLLLVIDNARDAEQVAALLPANPHGSVIVTSRNRLTSLIANHNATMVSLDVFQDNEAHALLASRLGSQRTAAEPAAVERLVAACGGLPLALSITVGRAQEHPEFSLAALATELHDAGSTLNALDVDADLSIRSVLSTSYAALSPPQAAAFRLLGLVAGPDISLAAASSLIGRSSATTRTLLWALERASLIQQHSPGRFRMHDLVQLYAREQAEHQLTEDDRRDSLRRLVGFYLHTVVIGAHVMDPGRPTIEIAPLPEGCTPIPLRDVDEATEWFDLEAPNITAINEIAQEFAWHDVVWQLAWATNIFYARAGEHYESIVSWRAGLSAAEALGDLKKIGLAHRFAARPNARVGNNEEALRHGQTSLVLAEQTGSVVDKLLALLALSEVHWRMQDTELSAARAELAWRLAEDEPLPIRARHPNHLAWYLAQDGPYEKARHMAEIALVPEIHSEAWDMRATTLDELGPFCPPTKDFDQATGYLQEAIDLFSTALFSLADTLYNLGETYGELGRIDEARTQLLRSRTLYEEQHRIQDVRRAVSALENLDKTTQDKTNLYD